MNSKSLETDLTLLDSITDCKAEDVGKVGVCGSHGGLIAATLASRARLRAVALNDAGRGLEDAGVAGLRALESVGMAGVAVDVQTALIGNAQDNLQFGKVSFVNEVADKLGLSLCKSLASQLDLLENAPLPTGLLDEINEARWHEPFGLQSVLCVDSASMIAPSDAGEIIVTGSHGGLIGGDPGRACKADASAVFFNDAGGGKDDCGTTRLPALDQREIAALALDCNSCRIGDARSALETGVVSLANETAQNLGVCAGMTVPLAVATLQASFQ